MSTEEPPEHLRESYERLPPDGSWVDEFAAGLAWSDYEDLAELGLVQRRRGDFDYYRRRIPPTPPDAS